MSDLVEKQRADLLAVIERVPASYLELEASDVEVQDGGRALLVRRDGGEQDERKELTAEVLGRQLYRTYTNSTHEQGKGLRHVLDTAGVQRFAAIVKDACTSRWSWTPHVRLLERDGAQVVVEDAAGSRTTVNSLTFDGPDPHGEGRLLERPMPLVDHPAWLFVWGEQGINSRREPIVRTYWNLCAEGAAPFVRTVTKHLNRSFIPFHMKVLKDPAQYGRADGASSTCPATSGTVRRWSWATSTRRSRTT